MDAITTTETNQYILYNSSNGDLYYYVDSSGNNDPVLIGAIDNYEALESTATNRGLGHIGISSSLGVNCKLNAFFANHFHVGHDSLVGELPS